MIALAIPAITAALGASGAGAAGAASGASGAASMLPELFQALGGGSGGPAGVTKGAMQFFKAQKAKKAADNLMPALYDPQQVAMLNEIQQKARSINTGSQFAADMGQIDATTAGTNQAIVQAAGGDVSGTIQGLLSAQSNANRAKNQVLGQADTQSEFYNSMAADLQNRVSSRALELQMHLRNQRLAEGAQYAQDAGINTSTGLAMADPGSIDWLDVLKSVRKPKQTESVVAGSAVTTPSVSTQPQPIVNTLSPDSGFGANSVDPLQYYLEHTR